MIDGRLCLAPKLLFSKEVSEGKQWLEGFCFFSIIFPSYPFCRVANKDIYLTTRARPYEGYERPEGESLLRRKARRVLGIRGFPLLLLSLQTDVVVSFFSENLRSLEMTIEKWADISHLTGHAAPLNANYKGGR